MDIHNTYLRGTISANSKLRNLFNVYIIAVCV